MLLPRVHRLFANTFALSFFDYFVSEVVLLHFLNLGNINLYESGLYHLAHL